MPDGFSVFAYRLIRISEPYKPAQVKPVMLTRSCSKPQNVHGKTMWPAWHDECYSLEDAPYHPTEGSSIGNLPLICDIGHLKVTRPLRIARAGVCHR